MRYRGERPGQLWMLAGGPGQPGSVYSQEGILPRFTRTGFDVYLLSHRGTGNSTPLSCSFMGAGDDALTTCAADLRIRYGDGIGAFQSSEAARDLAAIITSAADGGSVYLWGQSYGTYWAQRFLQEFPDLVDAVVLDGVLGLTDPIGERPFYMHEVGLEVLSACKGDPECSAKFSGQDPVEVLREVMGTLDANPCGQALGITTQVLRWTFFSAIEANQGRALIPAVLRRIQRCDEADIAALSFLVGALNARGLAGMVDAEAFLQNIPGFTQTYFVHGLARDLPGDWDSQLADLEASWDELWFDPLELASIAARAGRVWPDVRRINPTAELGGALPPTLVVSGEWDVRTPRRWGEVLAARLGARQVVFPQAGHLLLDDTPTVSGERSCAELVVHAFLDDPMADPQLDCLGSLRGEDFSGMSSTTAALSNALLGTTDVWGDGLAPEPASDPATLRAVDRLRNPLRTILDVSL